MVGIGSPCRGKPRTVSALVSQLLEILAIRVPKEEWIEPEPAPQVPFVPVIPKQILRDSNERIESKVHYNKLWRKMLCSGLEIDGQDIVSQ